jgi:hypothetical protein
MARQSTWRILLVRADGLQQNKGQISWKDAPICKWQTALNLFILGGVAIVRSWNCNVVCGKRYISVWELTGSGFSYITLGRDGHAL